MCARRIAWKTGRLEDTNRTLDLSKSITERSFFRETQVLRKIIEQLKEKDRRHIDTTPREDEQRKREEWSQTTHTCFRGKTQLDGGLNSKSYRFLAFLFSDLQREPLGRWVRYPATAGNCHR